MGRLHLHLGFRPLGLQRLLRLPALHPTRGYIFDRDPVWRRHYGVYWRDGVRDWECATYD